MFISKDEKEIKWYWHDGKMHNIKINSSEDTLDLKELHQSAYKVIEDQEEMCKNIMFLGIALTGSSEGGFGFLMGWLIRSIKKDKQWQINHTEEEIPDEEVAEHLASLMEEGAKMLREKKGEGKPKVSNPTVGGPDATELFGK
jgi:hypothetical protein